jgi:hypothetical protein
LHRRNLFREISHGNESERIFIEKMAQDERIDPVTGEAHYYKSPIGRNIGSYAIKVPREPEFEKILDKAQFVKVIKPRDSDKYIVIKVYE